MFKTPEDFVVEELPRYEPSGTGTHTFFAVRKRGLNTFEAIGRIAEALGVRPRDIGYAGLKDKNAVTTQVLSVDSVAPEQVLRIDQTNIEILWAERHPHKLRIGHHRGNRFTLTMRDIPGDTLPLLKAVMARLETEGIPNRFGTQRFGNRNDSHLIGKALVKAEWETALRYLFAGDKTHGDPWTRRVHRELARKPIEKAIFAIPHRFRKLFLSAYQAYLFNHILEQRLPHLGKLLAGDIAVKHSNGAPFLVENPTAEQPRADALEISPSGPIFGYKMQIPTGAVLMAETALLANEGLHLENLRKIVGIRLPGTRRPLRMPIQVHEVSSSDDNSGVRLGFTLPPGGYATRVVEALFAAEEDPT